MMQGPGVVAPLVWSIALDNLTSSASEIRNRIFHSPSVLVGKIPYERCLKNQTFPHLRSGSGRGSSRTLFIID